MVDFVIRTTRMSQAPQASAKTPPLSCGCFHCGEPCSEESFSVDGNPFCCLGCQTVFTLLQCCGLQQFYALNPRAGIRVRDNGVVAQWAFLDDPILREKLLDFESRTQAKVTLHLPAIHCVACVWLLENLFKLHPGIGRSVVNYSRREVAVAFAPDKMKLSNLAALLASLGYEPALDLGTLEKPKATAWETKTRLQIGVAGFAFGNMMLMSLPFYFGLDSVSGPWFKSLSGWLGLALALPVVTFSASDFWRSAASSFRLRRLTMEVPIALGLAVIYATSVFEVLSHRGPGYCDSLCGLIFFLLCGRVFQRRTYNRLAFDRDYKGFFPLSVIRKTAAGEESIAISRLQAGDRVVLRNGELLPADACLVRGEARLDYSFVTGESEPVACDVGSRLFAGGRQVGGMIEVETVKPVAQSYLASLWDHEAFRKSRTDDLDSLTNRYSQRFTKSVMGVALAAAVFWLFKDAAVALKAFTSVLIVACPCALALAAPLTHGTAQRLLARIRFYLKNPLVVERMAEVDTIVLDKTGTLTCAGAGGAVFQSAAGQGAELSAEEAGWVGALARYSTHPHSVRIAQMFPQSVLPVASYRETPGGGIEGKIAGHIIQLGSQAWLEKSGIPCASRGGEAPAACAGESEPGGASAWVAMDGALRGGFVLGNGLRPEVGQMLARLGGRYELALLSGDNDREAGRFKLILGERALMKFNQSPADKLNFIRELQSRGRRVMMVGDGLNDAGALKQAEVGVAVVERVGVFSPASDVILDAADLPRLAAVLRYSKRAALIVRAGFAVSTGYNLVGVSIAAAGLLSPLVCAILMPVSSATMVVFACGATVWMGRKLSAHGAGELAGPAPRGRFFNSRLIAQEAA